MYEAWSYECMRYSSLKASYCRMRKRSCGARRYTSTGIVYMYVYTHTHTHTHNVQVCGHILYLCITSLLFPTCPVKYICQNVFIHSHTHTPVYIYVCKYAFAYMRQYLWVLHTYAYTSMHMSIYICLYIYTHTHTHTHTHTYTVWISGQYLWVLLP